MPTSQSPISIDEILRLHRDTVVAWHQADIANSYSGWLQAVCEQHSFNFRLWHEEDVARSPDVSDERIAAVKRAIDGFNQQRNDRIEKLDEYLLKMIADQKITPPADAPLNTETPGSTIDRLSILSLRIYHLEEELNRADATTQHKEKVATRLAICQVQRIDLATSLGQLLEDLFAGRKRLKVYRQLKMYNDPTLNPYLYKAERKAG